MKDIPLTSYQDILESREDYKALVKRLGIEDSISPHNRIYQAFDLIERFIPVYQDKIKSEQFIKTYNTNAELDYALSEMLELKYILDNLDKYKQDDEVLAKKIKVLSSGSLSPVNESVTNNESRNVQFELSLLCDFLNVVMEAYLQEPNPDILLIVDERHYVIECKRLSSAKKLNANVKDAMKQVKKTLSSKQPSYIGVVAISVNRLINDPEYLLASYSPQTAYTYISEQLEQLVHRHKEIWKKKSRLPGKRLPAVILHYSTIVKSSTDVSMLNLTFRTITNTQDNNPQMDQLKSDILPLFEKDLMQN